VDVVHLVEVDVVGLQVPQARLARLADVERGEAPLVGPLPGGAEDLRREHQAVATPAALGEPAADDPLRDAGAPTGAGVAAPAVDVRGGQEVDPVLEGAIHDRERVPLRGPAALPPEVHRAEAERADAKAEAAEAAIVHRSVPLD